MNINFTEEEFKTLMEITYAAGVETKYSFYSHSVKQDNKKYKELWEYIFSIAKEIGLENVIKEKKQKEEIAREDLYEKVKEFACNTQRISIAVIQRKFRTGYNCTADFVDKLEEEGVISSADNRGQRKVLIYPD